MKKLEIIKEKIYLTPVHRVSPQFRHNAKFTRQVTDGRQIEEDLNKSRHKDSVYGLTFNIDRQKNRLVTGLDVYVSNPYYGMSKEMVFNNYNLDDSWSKKVEEIVESKEIYLQHLLEIKHSVSFDFYTSRINKKMMTNNSTNFVYKEPNFLENFKLILYDEPNVFCNIYEDTGYVNPRGELAIYLAKNHNRIALSKNEIDYNSLYYIAVEDSDISETNSKKEIIKKATMRLGLLQEKETKFRNYQVAVVCSRKDGVSLVKDELSEAKIIKVLDSYVMDTSSDQLTNCAKFIKTTDLLKTEEGLVDFKVKYAIRQAFNKNIFYNRDGYIYWESQFERPDKYKHKDEESLHNFLRNEFLLASNLKKSDKGKEDQQLNWYKVLETELKNKSVNFE